MQNVIVVCEQLCVSEQHAHRDAHHQCQFRQSCSYLQLQEKVEDMKDIISMPSTMFYIMFAGIS